jgi:hypothetical protein
LGVIAEIWVDGSFVTHKANPRDVDVVAIIPVRGRVGETTPSDILRAWREESHALNAACDLFVLPWFPAGHPDRWQTDALRDYWLDEFGAHRHKGVLVLRIQS